MKLALDKRPDYDAATHSWAYRIDVTYKSADKTQICPKAEGKIEHTAPGKPWHFTAGRDLNCEQVLDAQ